MDVPLSPELSARLARLAQKRGVTPEHLVREAIDRLIDHDDWFVHEVEKGQAQVESAQTLPHAEVGARLSRHLEGKRGRWGGDSY
jgi:predicted transcriptional regulator